MKSHIAIIASLFLASTPFTYPAIASETKIVTQEINPYIKENIAREISVKITSDENGGSGVIIAQQDNTYLILTNAHVLRDDDTFNIQTHDEIIHQAKPVDNGIETDDDLALLEFSSDNSYQTATINSAATPRVDQSILAVGYDAATGKLVVEEGKIERVPDRSFRDGYSIGYSNNIVQGMSGGAILNVNGEVIGINGKSAFPIVNTGYIYQDGSKPTQEEIEQYRQLSWGLTINRLLTQISSEIIAAFNLPLPKPKGEIQTTHTGWIEELEAKAKLITVRIDSNSGANGSGVIIAKEGNTYTVLTTDHVICEKNKERNCIDYTYEIFAPDGKKITLDKATVKRQEGVDLAIFKFVSNEIYQVAEIANYPVQDNDAVFVAGYPRLERNKPAPWLFSLGFSLERERGLISVSDSSLFTDSSELITSQGSLAGGYEMVYSTITYGGMSGGAVLDREGRVIGIHGLTEGQTTFNSQNSSEKQIQLGYSLGIPINTFLGLVDRFKIDSSLSIQNNHPKELNPAKNQAFQNAILSLEISQGNATAEKWLERGNQLWRLSRNYEAIEKFNKVIALNPEFIHLAYYGKALALVSEEEYEAALANFELTTKTTPNFAPAFLPKSAILQQLNRPNEALEAIDIAISLQEDNANLYNEKGAIFYNLKDFPKATEAFNKAIQLNTRSVFYNNRGNVYYDRRELELALTDYNRAIKLNPNSYRAFNNRGNLYIKTGKTELALLDYNKAVRLNPNEAISYIHRAIWYKEKGKFRLALADLNKAIQLNSELSSAYNNRGLLYVDQERTELALADYNKAIQLNPNSASAYSNRGFLYRKIGKKELALADFNQALKLNPEFALAYDGLGLLYDDLGKKELALVNYNRAIKLDPYLVKAYSNRGNTYTDLGKIELALADYSHAIILNPNYDYAYYNRGVLYAKQERLDLALVDWNKTLEINPNYTNAYFNRGLFYVRKEKFDLALADFNKTLEINPNYTNAYFNRGYIYYEQGKLDLASKDLEQTLKIFPDHGLSHLYRGLIHAQQKKLGLALADWNKAITLIPNNADVYYNRGLLYFNQGKIDLALNDYNKVLKLNPNHSSAYFYRGLIYAQQKRQDLALSNWNKALLLNPEDANSYFYRGALYSNQEKWELAISDLNQVLKLKPEFVPAYVGLGQINHKLKKMDRALLNYNQALLLDKNNILAINNIGLIKFEQGAIQQAKQKFEQALMMKNESAKFKLALAVTLSILGDNEQAISMVKAALTTDRRYAEVEFLKKNLWGDKLIANTEKLLSHPQIKLLLAQPSI